MAVLDLLESLKKIADRDIYLLPDLVCGKPIFGSGCPTYEVANFEKSIGCELPRDYKDFLTLCGFIDAGDIYNGYFIHSPDLIEQLRVKETQMPWSILRSENSIQLLPVGSDGGGNLFMMSLGDDNLIFKRLHEISIKDGMLPIAENFSNFLYKVRDDWQHFSEGDQTWNYLSG